MKPFLLALLTVICFLSYSQVPQTINYQAVARNTSGNILPNQFISIELSIRDGSPTATIVYQEIDTATTNQFGLFTVAIGSGQVQVGTNLTAVNWSTGSKYLQVAFDPTGGSNFTNMGTTQLLSVPYALYAASSADGSKWSDYAVYSELEVNSTPPQTTLIDSTWQPRQLNYTEDSAGMSISRNGNSITLQPGKYHISASCQWGLTILPGGLSSSGANTLQILVNSLLRLATGSNTTLLLGEAEHPCYLYTQSPFIIPDEIGGNYSIGLDGTITVLSTSTITLQQYISYPIVDGVSGAFGYYTYITNAGIPMSLGQNEIYTRILIQKIN